MQNPTEPFTGFVISPNRNPSPEQYYEMWEQQKGRCKICGKKLPEGQYLCVDHNAETGEIRGLLCNQCNKGLGFFHDNTNVMENAIKYLKENE